MFSDTPQPNISLSSHLVSFSSSLSFNTPPVFKGVHVVHFLVFCVVFCRSLFVLLTFVLSVFLRCTDSDYTFGIFWSLCCLSLCDVRFWLHLWYLLVIVLFVFVRCTDSDYTFGIFWSLCCLSLWDVRILITPWVSFWSLCCLSFYDLRILITSLWYLQTLLIRST